MRTNSRNNLSLISVLILTVICLCDTIDPEYVIERRIDSLPRIIERTLEHALKVKDRPLREDVSFWCVNRNNSKFVRVYSKDPAETLRTKLDLTQSIAFLIHGWIDNYQRTWVRSMVNSYTEHVGGNICVVDWSRLALAGYVVSALKTESVGRYLGKFIRRLVWDGYFRMSSVYLIGHSMGAHIAGSAGAYLNGNIPLLIGLDPAGLYFTKYPLQPISKRLDPSDAMFVQTIHTDRYILGSDMNLGHTDFYPNGGATPQPGCDPPVFANSRTYLHFTCSHLKSVDYFIEALNPRNRFQGHQTFVFKQMNKGKTLLDRYFHI